MSTSHLEALGLAASNSGTYLGNGEWSKTNDAGLLQSINPTTNEVIAEVLEEHARPRDCDLARDRHALSRALRSARHAPRYVRPGGEL